jgi:ribosomal protein L24E
VLSALVILATGIATVSTPISDARAADPAVQNVYVYGDAAFYGSTGALALAQPIVGIAATRTGHGYWMVASDGGVFSFGDARFFGSTGALRLNKPIVGMAATPSGHGYWMVASDGGVFSFGDARFFGSTGALRLNKPIVGMAATPSGHGYWMVASDGGIFSFGDARFFGSTGALRLNEPIVGMAATPSGGGYWFVASDGGLFSFGDAGYHGSTAAAHDAAPVVGMAATPTGAGYWIAGSDASVTGFGDAVGAHPSSPRPMPPSQSAIGLASDPIDRGYWLASAPATDPKIEAAIAWFEARVGQHAYTGQCEFAVELAFGLQQGYPTARADWLAQPVKHLDWQNAPRGALVFYSTSADGHVAISLGDGRVASTSVNSAIGIVPTGYFQNPLGWAVSPFL